MNASRTQHIIVSGLVLLLALVITWISFTQQPSEAFVFPRLIAVCFSILGVWNFARALMGLARVGEGMNLPAFLNIIPGLAVILVIVFFAAKFFGFYVTSFIGFLTLFTLYDPNSHTKIINWAKRIAITSTFMLVIYVLFVLLLKVQTPRGLFF